MQIVQIITNNIQFIFNYLIIAETMSAVMLALILFVFKKNKNANLFLAFFIIIHSASFLPVYFADKLPTFSCNLVIFTMPANSLAGVFIYYFTLFMTGRKEKFNKKDIIHFMFFFSYVIAFILYRISNPSTVPSPNPLIIQLIIGSGIIISILYAILALIKIKKYSKDIKNYFSDIKSIDMNWLRKIIYFSILSSFIFAICLGIHSVLNIRSLYVVTFDLGLFIIILFILIFYIINQPELSRENREMYFELNNLNIKNSNNTTEPRYVKVHLDIHRQETYLKLLNEYMGKNKPHLNERITIKELSQGLNVPYHHLSIVINNLLKKNFYDFINEYRIREVLNILNKSKSEAVNILTIAFRCGFNSKSTFNRVFKKIMGTTPSIYKNTYE